MTFLLVSIVVFIVVSIYVKKRLTREELYVIAFFSIVLGFIVDIIFDLKYNVYGYFETGVQFAGFLPALFLFPTAGMLFMNFYPFNRGLVHKGVYILIWTFFCFIFEFFSLKSEYFYHNEWKLWYSALVYPILFWVHLLHLKFFRTFTK